MPVYNPDAIDYSKGVDIYDPVTQTVYSQEEAEKQLKYIKRRLIMKPRKIGAWVMTNEEAEEALRKQKVKKMENNEFNQFLMVILACLVFILIVSAFGGG